MGDQLLGEGDTADNTGTMPPAGNIDPNGMQTASTGAAGLAFVALSASGSGDSLASALGWGSHLSQVATAGLSFASLGRMDLFTIGLILVALSFLLNVASLVIRWQNRQALAQYYQREVDRRVQVVQANADRQKNASGQGSQPPRPY